MEQRNGKSSEKPLVFVRQDPQEYVLLYTKVGPEGALPQTRYSKPSNTEYAGPEELRELGFVSEDWAKIAAIAVTWLSTSAITGLRQAIQEELGSERALPLLEELHHLVLEREEHILNRDREERRGVIISADEVSGRD